MTEATKAPAKRASRTRTTPAPEAPAKKEESIQQLKNRLRNDAEREVINNHRDEFNALATKMFAEHGMEFVRRLTEEERAAEAIEKYYQQFPNLRPAATIIHADPPQAKAVPNGALATFRAGDYEYTEEPEEPDHYREVEAREGE